MFIRDPNTLFYNAFNASMHASYLHANSNNFTTKAHARAVQAKALKLMQRAQACEEFCLRSAMRDTAKLKAQNTALATSNSSVYADLCLHTVATQLDLPAAKLAA